MATVKYDVSGSDPEKALAGVGDPPPPGVYVAKIAEMNPGFSKGEDGKPDKTRPRVEVVFHIQDAKFKGYPMWYYLTFGKGFPEQKLDQFLLSVGIATAKGKRKGSFDTDEQIGKVVKIQIKGRKDKAEYDPEVKNVMPASEEDLEAAEAGGEAEAEVEVGGEIDLDALGAEADDGDDDAATALTTAAAEVGLDPDSFETWVELVTAIQEAKEGSGGGEEPDDGEEEDLEALGAAADDEDDAEAQQRLQRLAEEHEIDPDDYPTWVELVTAIQDAKDGSGGEDGYDDLELPALKEECKSRGLDVKGTKPVLIKRLRENDKDDAPF